MVKKCELCKAKMKERVVGVVIEKNNVDEEHKRLFYAKTVPKDVKIKKKLFVCSECSFAQKPTSIEMGDFHG